MKRYEVTAETPNSGKIKHVVLAVSMESAMARVRSAYGGQEIQIVELKESL